MKRPLDIVDLDGHLAVVWATALDANMPYRMVHYRQAPAPISDVPWSRKMVGLRFLSFTSTDLYIEHRYQADIRWQEWPVVTRAEAVQPPSNGKTYMWHWEPTPSLDGIFRNGHYRHGWVREDYPSCKECLPSQLSMTREINGKRVTYDSRHDPAWIYDPGCGLCHPTPQCNKKGVCAEDLSARD